MLNEDACFFLNIQDHQLQVYLLEHNSMHITYKPLSQNPATFKKKNELMTFIPNFNTDFLKYISCTTNQNLLSFYQVWVDTYGQSLYFTTSTAAAIHAAHGTQDIRTYSITNVTYFAARPSFVPF